MSVVAAYLMFVFALFVVQGSMWTGQTTYIPAPQTKHTQIYDMLPQHS